MKSFSIDIRWLGDDGQEARYASRWGIKRPAGQWTVADNLGRNSQTFAVEKNARSVLAAFLRAEAAKLEEV